MEIYFVKISLWNVQQLFRLSGKTCGFAKMGSTVRVISVTLKSLRQFIYNQIFRGILHRICGGGDYSLRRIRNCRNPHSRHFGYLFFLTVFRVW